MKSARCIPRCRPNCCTFFRTESFSRLGGKRDISVDVRVLAATNKPLESAVQEGLFREDLFYRLNVITIHIPPLRERREEILVFLDFLPAQVQRVLRQAAAAVQRVRRQPHDGIQLAGQHPRTGEHGQALRDRGQRSADHSRALHPQADCQLSTGQVRRQLEIATMPKPHRQRSSPQPFADQRVKGNGTRARQLHRCWRLEDGPP